MRSSPSEYELIRSRRKTVCVQVKRDGHLLVRAPYGLPEQKIREIIAGHAAWIEKQQARIRKEEADAAADPPLTDADIEKLADRALAVIPERVAYYAPLVGVSYGRITIRNQKTRWGSCSARGNLNFNCLLMLTPPEVLDSVVVHELCHRKYMNHSKQFYDEVLRVYPEYRKWSAWLRQNGGRIMRRMTGQ